MELSSGSSLVRLVETTISKDECTTHNIGDCSHFFFKKGIVMKTLLCVLLLCSTIWLVGCDEKSFKEVHPEYVTWAEAGKIAKAKAKENETVLQRRLAYLMDIPEVDWMRFEDNSVYIGFNVYPTDGEVIIKFAAVHGNNAINFGCHVWAVHSSQLNNPPYYGTMSDKWYGEATARYGRIR